MKWRDAKHDHKNCNVVHDEGAVERGAPEEHRRIGELRQLGVPIKSETVEGKNRYGEKSRYKRYWMPRSEARKEG